MEKKSKRKRLSPLFKKETFNSGIIHDFFDSIFSFNKSEKKKIISLLEKHSIDSLLFYTNDQNLTNLLKHGIVPLKNLKLVENEVYHVWSFVQQEESINLELDTSSRAYFWKWISDLNFDPKSIAIIGINPNRLKQLTKKDWMLDHLQNLINISEKIYVETFDWILVQDLEVYKKINRYLKKNNLKIDLYFGDNGVTKIQKENSEPKKPEIKKDVLRKETENEQK